MVVTCFFLLFHGSEIRQAAVETKEHIVLYMSWHIYHINCCKMTVPAENMSQAKVLIGTELANHDPNGYWQKMGP